MRKLKDIRSDLELHYMQESRTVFFHGEVGQFKLEDALRNLDYLANISKKPIILRICSPGGSVDYGLVLYDYIKMSKVPIHTLCSGMAASMAAILLGSGKKGKRMATKSSRIMIHQPSSGYIGKASDIEIHANETKRIRNLLNTIISKDTGQPLKKVEKDTELDLWMTAENALQYGIIDKIV
jgi:ATP-dependent Clp protease protease subunit